MHMDNSSSSALLPCLARYRPVSLCFAFASASLLFPLSSLTDPTAGSTPTGALGTEPPGQSYLSLPQNSGAPKPSELANKSLGAATKSV